MLVAKQKEWQKLMKETADLEPLVTEFTAYKKAEAKKALKRLSGN